MRGISHCLWFDDQAEDAARFYVSVFDDGQLGRILRYGEEGFDIHGKPAGSVMTVEFEIAGQRYTALNGGPQFSFNEAFSIVVECETQAEVDRFWGRLADGGEEGSCGWLKDRYGVSWQVVPTALYEMLSGPDAARSERVMGALLGMSKLDIAALERAYEGRAAERRVTLRDRASRAPRGD